jgi:molybdopterin-guanine dinucleotide biosynthesis protein A
MVYHDLPQREHLYALMAKVCDRTFYSIRKDQLGELPKDADVILDNNEYKGPYNGIISAHRKYPDVAWMVLACDLPLMDLNTVKQLLDSREATKYATAFATKQSGLPEPLAAIWEPLGLERSIDYLNAGDGSCPRKFLINSEVALVCPGNDQILLNANSQEDYNKALSKLSAT